MGHSDESGGGSGTSAGKMLRYLKEHGVQEFAAHAAEEVRDRRFDYQKWVQKNRVSSVQAGYQRKLLLPKMPKVFVLIARNQEEGAKQPAGKNLEATLKSIRASTYGRVCPVQAIHSQIRDEDYMAFVREGDLIERDAIFEMVRGIQDGADAVYTDEDTWDLSDGKTIYKDPLFKPDYDPDFLRAKNYIGCFVLVRVGVLRSIYAKAGRDKIPTSRNVFDPAYDWWLTIRIMDAAASMGGVKHVPKVLYHARRQEMDPDQAMHCHERARGYLQEILSVEGENAVAEDGPVQDSFHVSYRIEGTPLVSIIIPNADHASVLENCIDSIRSRSTWKRLEIVVVENNSREEETFALYRKLEERGEAGIVQYPHAFHFSRVINEGVRNAEGDYLILMNNDVTVHTPDWIEKLLSQAMRPGVGVCGPKLLYPDGRVQSAGIVTGIMGFAGSMMVALPGDDPGYMGRAVLTQNMSAVTAACMMVRRDAFDAAGGFPDEFGVALGDVDFCLSVRDAGYRVIFEPSAILIHHESLTRGQEDTAAKKKRFAVEKARFRKKRALILQKGDPFYNPNLSRRRCDYSQQT